MKSVDVKIMNFPLLPIISTITPSTGAKNAAVKYGIVIKLPASILISKRCCGLKREDWKVQ